jgi:hypothetical protein
VYPPSEHPITNVCDERGQRERVAATSICDGVSDACLRGPDPGRCDG